MTDVTTFNRVAAVREAAYPLTGIISEYDPLMNLIGNARFVLIGEASHGTHEFYEQRAEITKRLIQEKGFTGVAVEADWPDAYRVNRFVQGISDDLTPAEALGDFGRFPTWMWRNTDVMNFVGWLKEYNDSLPKNSHKVGFYGLDLYSMYASIDQVLRYLEQVDPEAANRARDRYSCFEHFDQDAQTYGYATSLGIAAPCQEEVVNQLRELLQRGAESMPVDSKDIGADELFYAQQNARLIKNAETYYRSMFQGRASTWNIRDRHQAETLDQLVTHFENQGKPAKFVVWEHNSHLGDARATEMGLSGEVNVGQLMRERYGDDVVIVGFTTYTGTVTAASHWCGTTEMKQVLSALPNSYEDLFHQTGLSRLLLLLRDNQTLKEAQLERAIGVIYKPETERISHYFYARLPEQFDAVIHIDDTRAVQPLDRTAYWELGEVPETFPSGL